MKFHIASRLDRILITVVLFALSVISFLVAILGHKWVRHITLNGEQIAPPDPRFFEEIHGMRLLMIGVGIVWLILAALLFWYQRRTDRTSS